MPNTWENPLSPELSAYIKSENKRYEDEVERQYRLNPDRRSTARDRASGVRVEALDNIEKALEKEGISDADLRYTVEGGNNDSWVNLGVGNALYGKWNKGIDWSKTWGDVGSLGVGERPSSNAMETALGMGGTIIGTALGGPLGGAVGGNLANAATGTVSPQDALLNVGTAWAAGGLDGFQDMAALDAAAGVGDTAKTLGRQLAEQKRANEQEQELEYEDLNASTIDQEIQDYYESVSNIPPEFEKQDIDLYPLPQRGSGEQDSGGQEESPRVQIDTPETFPEAPEGRSAEFEKRDPLNDFIGLFLDIKGNTGDSEARKAASDTPLAQGLMRKDRDDLMLQEMPIVHRRNRLPHFITNY